MDEKALALILLDLPKRGAQLRGRKGAAGRRIAQGIAAFDAVQGE